MGDCPLAQSIIVGLLRSLLTICNAQTHKTFSSLPGLGADSFREWQISYQYVSGNEALKAKLRAKSLVLLYKYEQMNKETTEEIT